ASFRGRNCAPMLGRLKQAPSPASGHARAPERLRGSLGSMVALAAMLALGACTTGVVNTLTSDQPPAQPTEAQPGAQIGTGQVRVGLILPLSAPGNAGLAAQSMRNAAEMAIAEFKNPNIQLLVKDDAGNPQSAQAAAQQAIGE